MLRQLYNVIRPALMGLDPERAHEASLRALELGAVPRRAGADVDVLSQTVWGLNFRNPLGIAAGYDKDARVPDALIGLGMGFAEIGTVTPRPQTGNPRPRVFRLPEADAVINRLGFNNQGHAAALRRLERRQSQAGEAIVGVNIGANKDSTDRAADYALGITTFAHVASYFTVNVSSPNTPGLRDLQAPAQLAALLQTVLAARDSRADTLGHAVPVVVKLAPDVAADDLPAILDCILAAGADGICVSNTTLTRPKVGHLTHGAEAGGLSGAPLFDLSTAMLATVYHHTGGAIPLIGVGGIHSGTTAVAKIAAGASLIQLYTGLIYGGPGLIDDIKTALVDAVGAAGVGSISDLVGRDNATWRARWPRAE